MIIILLYNKNKNILPWRSWKAGRFEMMSLTGNSHPKLARCSRVARAPAQQRLPAFLNLHGIFTLSRKKRACRLPDKTCQEIILNGLNNSFFITDSISTKSWLIFYDKNSFCQTCGFFIKINLSPFLAFCIDD